jgi:uncharacterized membrane protein
MRYLSHASVSCVAIIGVMGLAATSLAAWSGLAVRHEQLSDAVG